MKIAPLAVLVLGAASCFGQIKLYVLSGPTNNIEQEVTGSSYDLGSAGAGDTIQTRFRIRNVGTTAQQIQSIRAAGQGFTLSIPSLPFTIAPNGPPLELTVRFSGTGSGSYSANFTAGTIAVLLRATVTNAPVLVTENSTGNKIEVPAQTLTFLGNVQRGQASTKTFWLENRGSSQVTVNAIAVANTSGPFSYRGPTPPFSIAPGASQTFDLSFSPSANQQYSSSLTIDGRVFPLAGTGYDPPLPKPSILIDGSVVSGQQPKLSIQLAGPAPSVVNGTLRMEFKSAVGVDDPAIRFTSSNGRNLSVQSREGDAVLWINGSQKDAVFQTGTTAGTIVWTLEIGTHIETQTAMLSPAAAVIDNATAGRRTQDLDVTLVGFDNTRSISQALFTFYDASGRPIAPGTIRSDVRREFEQYYTGSTTGGVFTMRATFPVQGPAAQITGVEVEIVNSAGGARTTRLAFPAN